MSLKVTSTAELVDKQDFYLYKTLKEIHARVQSDLQKLEKLNLLLILNTPGSLEHLMIHTDQRYFQEIFYHLFSHVLKQADKGCIEFGYKLLENDQFCFYVNDPTGLRLIYNQQITACILNRQNQKPKNILTGLIKPF